MDQPTSNAPLNTKQFDRVQAAIWCQNRETENGTGKFYTLTLSRSYKDEKGEWKKSHSFSDRDLPHMHLAVDWAMRELLLKED